MNLNRTPLKVTAAFVFGAVIAGSVATASTNSPVSSVVVCADNRTQALTLAKAGVCATNKTAIEKLLTWTIEQNVEGQARVQLGFIRTGRASVATMWRRGDRVATHRIQRPLTPQIGRLRRQNPALFRGDVA